MDTCVGDVPNGADVDTGTLGEHSFTVTATDHAGNSDSAVAHYTVVDVTPPQIALDDAVAGRGVRPRAAGGRELLVRRRGRRLRPGGLHRHRGERRGVDTSSVGEKSFTVNATDNAGNPASQTVTYTVVDRVGPDITVGSPSDGAVYGLGDRVLADYSCADQPGGSGVATCTGTVAKGAPIDTSSFGAHTFEVSATDGAGNSAKKTVTYSVVYDFDGFFWPVKNLPGATRWKAGLPVPVRFSCTASGARGPRRTATRARCAAAAVTSSRRRARLRARRSPRSSTTGAPTST